MRRKITWTRFLQLGSLFAKAALTAGCGKGRVDAWVTSDWIFVNASTHKVEVVYKTYKSFVIEPGKSYTYSTSGLGPPNVTPDDFYSPYRGTTAIIIDDDIVHEPQMGESITNVPNFEAEKVERNHYKFTYVFTDEYIETLIAGSVTP